MNQKKKPVEEENAPTAVVQKPRALSRQAEADIKLEVHRDENIKMHLQREHKLNMNLMFYDFNGSSQTHHNTA